MGSITDKEIRCMPVLCGIAAILAAAALLAPHIARAAQHNAKKLLLVVTVTKDPLDEVLRQAPRQESDQPGCWRCGCHNPRRTRGEAAGGPTAGSIGRHSAP